MSERQTPSVAVLTFPFYLKQPYKQKLDFPKSLLLRLMLSKKKKKKFVKQFFTDSFKLGTDPIEVCK